MMELLIVMSSGKSQFWKMWYCVGTRAGSLKGAQMPCLGLSLDECGKNIFGCSHSPAV